MKIFVYVHMWPPKHCAGSEVTVHAAMREMVRRGHSVTTIADRTPESYEYEGVKVLSLPQQGHQFALVKEYAKDADVLITHLDVTSPAMQLSLDLNLPLVHFVHNHMQLGFHSVPPHKAHLVIFNSEWVAQKQEYKGEPWPGPSVVMHPVVEPDRYRCERGTKITLCNPTDGKGIATLHRLSEAMPDYQFLVVEGIYGEQVAPPNLGEEWVRAHPNIQHMKNSPDFRDVLRKTKVLLMPSNYESYGRCAVEAACAGIPSIVHPTEGLLESLGAEREPTPTELQGGWVSGAGIFCDRADIPSWQAQIERLYTDEIYYRSRSDAALKLANDLDPDGEFDRLEAALVKVAVDWKIKQEIRMPKMWVSDRRLWDTTDGKLVAEVDGRIPQNATRLAVGIGTEIPEEVARAHGFLPPLETVLEPPAEEGLPVLSSKSLSLEEDKAIHSPEENKAKRKKKVA